MDLKNLTTRAASGAVYVAVIVGATLSDNEVVFGAFVALLALWASVEYSMMIHNTAAEGERCSVVVPIMDAVTTVMVAILITAPYAFLMLLARVIYAIFDKQKHPIRSLAYSVMGYLYIGIPLLLLFCIELSNYRMVMLLFCALWINDTGAYLVGSMMGKHKLCERISPKKTIEGFVGGAMLNVIVALVVSICFPDIWGNPIRDNWIWVIIAVILVSIFGTLGDLFESLLKRTVGVKDSGHLIPGHGGILDRIDSLLFAGPVLLLLLLLIQS